MESLPQPPATPLGSRLGRQEMKRVLPTKGSGEKSKGDTQTVGPMSVVIADNRSFFGTSNGGE